MTFQTKEIKEKGAFKTLTLEGRLISETDAQDLTEKVSKQIENGKVNFIFDLSKLEYINSSGLNTLIHTLTTARNNGGEIILCEMHETVKALLVATKLNSIFTVKETLAQAEAYLNELSGKKSTINN